MNSRYAVFVIADCDLNPLTFIQQEKKLLDMLCFLPIELVELFSDIARIQCTYFLPAANTTHFQVPKPLRESLRAAISQ